MTTKSQISKKRRNDVNVSQGDKEGMSCAIAPPKRIWVEPTNLCNLQCAFCFQSNSSMTRKRGMMDFETFKGVVDDVKPFRPELCLHHSGESFLNKELPTFIKYAKKQGLKVGMTTNGTLIRRNNFEILDTGIDVINISLAGANDDDYRKIRSASSFEEIKKAIADMASEKVKRGTKTKIFVNITETANNRGGIRQFREYFSAIDGIDGVTVRRLMDWSGRVNTTEMRVCNFKRSLFMFALQCNKYVKRIKGECLCGFLPTGCGILWDGTVVPCCYDFNADMPLGNIREERFLDIWGGKRTAALRSTLSSISSAKKHSICSKCIFPK